MTPIKSHPCSWCEEYCHTKQYCKCSKVIRKGIERDIEFCKSCSNYNTCRFVEDSIMKSFKVGDKVKYSGSDDLIIPWVGEVIKIKQRQSYFDEPYIIVYFKDAPDEHVKYTKYFVGRAKKCIIFSIAAGYSNNKKYFDIRNMKKVKDDLSAYKAISTSYFKVVK